MALLSQKSVPSWEAFGSSHREVAFFIFIIIFAPFITFWLRFHNETVGKALIAECVAGWKELVECLEAFPGRGKSRAAPPAPGALWARSVPLGQLNVPARRKGRKGHKSHPNGAHNSQTGSFLFHSRPDNVFKLFSMQKTAENTVVSISDIPLICRDDGYTASDIKGVKNSSQT